MEVIAFAIIGNDCNVRNVVLVDALSASDTVTCA